jgi:hypothetical protein
MSDPSGPPRDLRERLAALAPLRRRVIRVYWTRGLLVGALLALAAPLALASSLASAFFVGRATGRSPDGELALHLAPILIAFLVPLAAVGLLSGSFALAILRRFGRRTIREYEIRHREQIVTPLLLGALPDATLDLDGRVGDAAIAASRLFGADVRGASGALLAQGRACGVAYAASVLGLAGSASGGREPLFQGFFAHLEVPGRFEDTTFVFDGARCPGPAADVVSIADDAFCAQFVVRASQARSAQAALSPRMRALLLELRRLAGLPLQVSLHPGGVALAVPARLRGLLVAPRVRPGDPAELTRQAGLYGLVREAARGLADL